MTSVTRSGSVTFTRAGQGPPLLLIHGLGSDNQVWQPLLSELASKYDVINVDLPGHGGAPRSKPGAAATPQAIQSQSRVQGSLMALWPW